MFAAIYGHGWRACECDNYGQQRLSKFVVDSVVLPTYISAFAGQLLGFCRISIKFAGHGSHTHTLLGSKRPLINIMNMVWAKIQKVL